VWTSDPPLGPPNLPPANTTTPARTRDVASGISQTATTPIFRYYAKDSATGLPTELLATPLSAVDLRRAVLIDVSFTSEGKRDDVSTDYSNQILTRSATCV